MLGACKSNNSVLIQELDYSYIGDCADGSKLEDVLKVLRSGEEGVYPDLISFAERRLSEIKPTSSLLCSSNNKEYITAKSAYKDESSSVNKELENWQNEIKTAEEALKAAKPIESQLPPIRQTGIKSNHSDMKETQANNDQTSNLAEGLPPKEYDTLALSEKLKGNDAFRSEDFSEALNHYNKSLSISPQTAVYNNRAAVFLKLKKYKETMDDCQIVLKAEPQNLKAMLRMAIAEEATGKCKEAISTLKKLLDIEPKNKRAEELLDNLTKTTSSTKESDAKEGNVKQRGTKLKIEEIDSAAEKVSVPPVSSQSDKMTIENQEQSSATKETTGKRLKITEVENMTDVENKEKLLHPDSKINDQPIIEYVDLPIQVLRLKDEGNNLYKTGKYAEACNTYAIALDKLKSNTSVNYRPSDIAVLHSNRAAALQRTGNSKESINDASRAIQLFPSAKALTRRATAYETIEKYSHSYVDHQSALRIDSTLIASQQASTRLSSALREKHGSSWRNHLPDNNIKHTSNIFTQSQTGHHNITNTSNKTGTNVSQKPNPVQTYDELKKKGNGFVTQGKYKEAIPFYSECIKLRNTETSALTNRALCYIKVNMPLKAIDDCINALVIEPSNVKALYRCALARKMTKSYKASLVDLKKLLEIETSNSAAKTLFENVKALYKQELVAMKTAPKTKKK